MSYYTPLNGDSNGRFEELREKKCVREYLLFNSKYVQILIHITNINFKKMYGNAALSLHYCLKGFELFLVYSTLMVSL